MPEKLPIQNFEISKENEQKKPRYIKSEKVRENKRNIMGWLGRIRDAYRESIVRLLREEEKVTLSKNEKKAAEETRKYLIKKMDAEQERIEKLATREGVNFSKCQMGEIGQALLEGKLVEYEALSPYLADYNTVTGEMWKDKLIKADAIGLAVSAVVRKAFDALAVSKKTGAKPPRLVSLYDEYNSGMPDSTDLLGAPKSDGPQLTYSDQTGENFKNSIVKLLESNGSIKKTDKEGENYLFVKESSKVKDAERELVPRLKEYFKAHPGQGGIEEKGLEINFVNNTAENPKYRKIQLRTPNGRWRCEALDASSYLNPENLKITHLVILPNEFIEQQDKVWEMLRILGIQPTNYHNIFYDQDKPPETVARVIQEEIEKSM